MTRTQFPVVAGFALTVNKAPGVTVEESVAIHLNGSENNRPALAGGMPYVAFTRLESFRMTAFCSPPSCDGFVEQARGSNKKRRRERHGVPALSVMPSGGGTVVDGRHWPSALTLLGVGPEVPATCETVFQIAKPEVALSHSAASERAGVDPVLPDIRAAAGASSDVPRSAASVPDSLNLGVPGRTIRMHHCCTALPLSTHALAPCFQDGRHWASLLRLAVGCRSH